MKGRVFLVLCNLAASGEERATMLNGGAVECLANMLSYGGLQFRGLAKEAGTEETLENVEKIGSEHAKKKTSRILEVLRGNEEEDEKEIDWKKLLESENGLSRIL
ncbi:U-box domain-containing protein 40 [Abeliophyllum distichum]|uniref:U-box domain-containing protein 40 n=1 Tax=Abeliophyllum distichum TaxID=126358 RepID=A0ABD1RF27_9LAMI